MSSLNNPKNFSLDYTKGINWTYPTYTAPEDGMLFLAWATSAAAQERTGYFQLHTSNGVQQYNCLAGITSYSAVGAFAYVPVNKGDVAALTAYSSTMWTSLKFYPYKAR